MYKDSFHLGDVLNYVFRSSHNFYASEYGAFHALWVV